MLVVEVQIEKIEGASSCRLWTSAFLDNLFDVVMVVARGVKG